MASEAVVEEDSEGRYVEHDGLRYRSSDLPSVGTDVKIDTYTGIDEGRYAEIEWSADCPAGYSFTTARAWSI